MARRAGKRGRISGTQISSDKEMLVGSSWAVFLGPGLSGLF